MKIYREDAVRTRRSLLESAVQVFAEKGYRDATVSQICSRAGTNIASVNYHFGNKESLYVEAWRLAFREAIEAHPPDGGVRDDAPPEDRLKGQIVSMVRRMADKNNREFLFVQREFANPTGLLEKVMKEEIQPLHKRTEGLVRELLSPLGSDQAVQFCEISIISQCFNPMIAGRRPKGMKAPKGGPPVIDDIDAYAEHIATFSLAGIEAVRKAAESKKRVHSRR